MPAPDYNALLGAYVEAAASDANVVRCAATALGYVTKKIGTRTVPDDVKTEAVLTLGADLYYRRTARNGIVGINSVDVQPVRIGLNPYTAADNILKPYLLPGIG